MDPISEFTKLSGFQQLQAIFAGETGYKGIVPRNLQSERVFAMTVSMYAVSIPIFIRHLNGLNTVLDKAAGWADQIEMAFLD